MEENLNNLNNEKVKKPTPFSIADILNRSDRRDFGERHLLTLPHDAYSWLSASSWTSAASVGRRATAESMAASVGDDFMSADDDCDDTVSVTSATSATSDDDVDEHEAVDMRRRRNSRSGN